MRNLLKSLGSLILSATIAVSPLLSIPATAEYTGDAGNGQVTYTNESPLMKSPFTDEKFTYYAHYKTNKEWTVMENGWYRFYMIGAGGRGESGSSGGEGRKDGDLYLYYGAGGQGGGGGGVAVHQVFLNKGEKVSMAVNSASSTLTLGNKVITGFSANGTTGGTASGANIANVKAPNGLAGQPRKESGKEGLGQGFNQIEYTQKQSDTDEMPSGFGIGGDGGHGGRATSQWGSYRAPTSGLSGTAGAVVIEKYNGNINNKPTLGVMQQPIKNSYLVSAYACSEPNMILPEWHGFENQGGYASGGWANGKDEAAPEPNGVTANLAKSGTEEETNWIVADINDNLGSLGAGDMLWVSGYYRESDYSNVKLPLQFGGFFNADNAEIPTTVVASYDTHVADGQWHPFFYIVKSNLPIKNAKTKILEWPASSGNGSITINGLQVQHVSSGKLVSNAVLKWDAGEHDVAYFKENGQSLGSGVTFTAPAIGEYTVYMKDTVTETELVRTIGVENIIPLDPVMTVSPNQEWFKDTATILLEKQGDDKGNDQITLWYSTHKDEDGKDTWELYSVPVQITESCMFKAKAINRRSFESDPVEQVIQFDKTTPMIATVEFAEDAKSVTITGTDEGGSGFKGVYVNDVLKFAEENGQVAVFVPDDVYSLELQAVDGAGNKSDIRTESVPDVVPPTIDSCTFAGGGLSAVIKASDKGSSGLKGIYVNEQFYEGDTVDYKLPEGITTIEIQAEDNAGNKSDVKTETVPDNIPPVIESVEFSKDNKTASILLSDTGGSGVKGATINGEFFEGSEFTYTVPDDAKYLEIQAMDKLNNKSETMKKRVPGWSEIIDTITIKPVEFRENNTMATITAETSLPNTTIAGIYVNDVFYDANPVIYKVPNGATTLQLQAVNNEGDKSVIYNLDVPQWGGGVRITSVSFSEQNDFTKKDMEAYIKAVDDTGHNIQGVYVNGEYFDGDAITYTIAPGTRHLEIQAINTNGDTSEVMIKRVPGWSEVVDTLTIESVNFASSGIATITAASTDSEVAGIYVNDKFFDGNPILYTITSSTKTLKLQAENEDGDKSAVMYKEVTFNNKAPIVNSLAVNSVAFDDTIATVAATSTGADITGIYVNDKLYDGNPVLYPITSSTKTLKAQAVNVLGERSPVVYKEVPENKKKSSTTSKGKARISISAPDWTSARKTRVRISVSDKNGIDTVTASTSYGVEEDITDEDYIYITKDTTVAVEVLNDDGETTKKSTPIECFDHDAPTVSVSQSDNILNIKAIDRKSGVAKIYVNNKLYRVDERVSYTVPKGATSVNVYAEDNAGNKSDAIDYPLKKEQKPITAIPAAGAVTTVTPTPTPPAPTPEPPEDDIEIEAEEDSEGEEQPFINLLPDPELKPNKEASAGTVGKVVGSIFLMGGSGAAIWYYFHKKRNMLPESSLDDDFEYEYVEDDGFNSEQEDTSKNDDENENVQNVDFKVS